MVHLFVGQIPLVGSGLCLLLLIFGIMLRSTRVLRIGLFLIALITLFAIWAYLSGSATAEVALKHNPHAEPVVSAHKEAASTAFVVILATGVIAFAALLFRRPDRSLPSWYTLMVTLLLIIALALLIGAAGLAHRISRPWLVPPSQEKQPGISGDTSSALSNPPAPAAAAPCRT